MSLQSRELFQEISMKSSEAKEILDLLSKSYLDPVYESKWLPAKIHLIQNKSLEHAFLEKIREFENLGCRGDEVEPKFGFLVAENDPTSLLSVSQSGLSIKDSEYNAIGYNCMGVYLCKHADVCLQHAVVKFSTLEVIRMVIFKYVTGKTTTAIPRVATVGEFIEPTQGFNSHVSVIQPTRKDSLQTQFDRSQVYLYEIDKFFQPVAQPRHLIPYAVVVFTVNGVAMPQLDSEFVGFTMIHSTEATVDSSPTSSNPEIVGNLKLQQAIEQINAKAPPDLFAQTRNCKVVSVKTSELDSVSVKSPLTSAALLNASETSQLQKVISELNARYEMATAVAEGKGMSAVEKALMGNCSSSGATVFTLDGMLAGNSCGSSVAAAMLGKSGRLSTSFHQQQQQQQQCFSYADLLSATSSGLQFHFAKPDLQSQSLLGGYSTVGFLQATNQLGFFGDDSTLTDLGGGMVGLSGGTYAQLQGVNLPTVAMPTVALPTVLTGLVDPSMMAGGSGGALYQQEFIPVEYLSSVVGSGAKGQTAYYPIQSATTSHHQGYTIVNQGLKRSMTDPVPCVEKRPRMA